MTDGKCDGERDGGLAGAQALVLITDAQLGLPGGIGHALWQTVLAVGDDGRDTGAVQPLPGQVDQHAARRPVARLRDAALAPHSCGIYQAALTAKLTFALRSIIQMRGSNFRFRKPW